VPGRAKKTAVGCRVRDQQTTVVFVRGKKER
jgi:hypothetical protein